MLRLTRNNPRALLKLIAKQQDKLYEVYQLINKMQRNYDDGLYDYSECSLKDDIEKIAEIVNDYV